MELYPGLWVEETGPLQIHASLDARVEWHNIQSTRHPHTLWRHRPEDFGSTCVSPSFSHFVLLTVRQARSRYIDH